MKVTRFSSSREKAGNDIFTKTIFTFTERIAIKGYISSLVLVFASYLTEVVLAPYLFCRSSLLWQHKTCHSHSQLLCKHRSIKKLIRTTNVFFFNINFSPWKLHHHSIDSFDPSDKCLFCNWGRKVWKANFDLFVDRFLLNVLFS